MADPDRAILCGAMGVPVVRAIRKSHLAAIPGNLNAFPKQLTYDIREAQAQLSKLCRGARKFVIANRDKPVFVALPVADFEALLEARDVLADPKAMKTIRQSRGGLTKYAGLNLDEENFGL